MPIMRVAHAFDRGAISRISRITAAIFSTDRAVLRLPELPLLRFKLVPSIYLMFEIFAELHFSFSCCHSISGVKPFISSSLIKNLCSFSLAILLRGRV